MSIRNCNKKLIVLFAIVLAIFALSSLVVDNAYASSVGIVYGTGSDGLNVRSGPGSNYGVIDALWDGDTVTIIETSGNWYKISYSSKTGYVSADYIKISEEDEDDYVYNEDFENLLEQQGFPSSYKEYLRKLHAAHPEWVFKAQHTGLDWTEVIDEESVVPRNLVHQSADDSWKSKEYGAYNFETGEYIIHDSGGWVAASRGIIEYYMDPRNFLNDTYVFQFMSHSYDAQTQTKSGLQELVAETFLDNKFPENGYETYSDVLMYAGKNANANPYVLASMILVEQGNDGHGGSISGKVSGFEGYYNYFNVRAYAYGEYDAVEYGLLYAKGSGSYERPWNTRTKSIIGGALHYTNNYINNNQNTLYLKKYNVMNGMDDVATHQYMTNVGGAAQEAANLKEGYKSSDAITFYVPVFKNMPEVPCAKPESGSNDYFLKSLEVAGYDLLPKFDKYTEDYEIIVSSDATSVSIEAVPSDPKATVKGTGKVSLSGNVTEADVVVTSTSGQTKTYTITIAKEDSSSQNLTSSKYNIDSVITGVDFETSVTDFKNKLTAPTGCTIEIVNANGDTISSGNVGTNTKVIIYKDGKALKSIPIVIKGDPSGDGKLSSVDVLYAQRHIVKTYTLGDSYFKAADINGDGKITSVDALYMQRDIVGTYTIEN